MFIYILIMMMYVLSNVFGGIKHVWYKRVWYLIMSMIDDDSFEFRKKIRFKYEFVNLKGQIVIYT